MTTGTVDRSIEELESKIAYLEHAVSQLSDVVYRQQQEIQALAGRVDQLQDRLQAAQTQEGPTGAELERPPHW